MGKLLKYSFYIGLVAVAYLVGMGIYRGSITKDSTVGQVVSDMGNDSKKLVQDGVKMTKNALDRYNQAEKEEVELIVEE